MNKPNNVTDAPERFLGKRVDGLFSVSGIVHVIRDESELPFFREGEILVARQIDRSWTTQLSLAKALIEDAEASESGVVEIASRYEIPAIIQVVDAMQLRSGDIVTLHGNGDIERVPEQRAPDSHMRVSVPAAVSARNQTGITTASNVVAFKDIQANEADSHENLSDDDPAATPSRK